eukprot:3898182-Rhodomonas_salina.1
MGQKQDNADMSPLPSEQPVERPTMPEPQLTFVLQGYNAEPGPNGVPRFVKEGHYRTRPYGFQHVGKTQ